MSLAIVHSRAQVRVGAPAVTVEAHLANGLPALTLVGLPEASVKESKDRVRSAILNSGLDFPARRITLNLAPADLPKDGGRFDLAIALGILAGSGQLPIAALRDIECLGELALSGAVRPVQGLGGFPRPCLSKYPGKTQTLACMRLHSRMNVNVTLGTPSGLRGLHYRAARLLGNRKAQVAVAMAVTCDPPHRSVRAELPHTAPALGFDAEAGYEIRMHW